MKIIFATGKLNKTLSPTVKIIFQIAKALAYAGHKCCICGFSSDCCENTEIKDNVKLLRWNSSLSCDKAQLKFEQYSESFNKNDRASARKSFLLKHPIHSIMLGYRYSSMYNDEKKAKLFAERVKKYAIDENADIVVCVYMPFNESYQVYKQLYGTLPLCAYQTDPWGLHRLPQFSKNQSLHIRQETELFGGVQHIITTPALYKLYKEDSRYAQFTNKMTALNFPNIKPPYQNNAKCVFDFDSTYTNILFCGLLDDEYRSPKIFLESICRLIDNGEKIRVYFLGTSTSCDLAEFTEKYPDNILHHEAVSFENANATMQNADFLLNISNTLDNQVPSKIFDYFALGKPVINVQKIYNCPSREYFNRYPLAFTFEDFSVCSDALKDFLVAFKGKKTDYETVKTLFKDATVEYVSQKTEQILTDILNDKQNYKGDF